MPRRFFRSLHEDAGGQISFVVLFGAVAFVALLGLVTTTGDQVTLKVRTQNATDMGALAGGAWIARGLNLTSAINVMQTQLVSASILLNSLAKTIEIAALAVPAMQFGWCACAATGLGCIACCVQCWLTTIQKPMLETLKFPLRSLANSLARCPDGLLWKATSGLAGMNQAIHAYFYTVARLEARYVVQESLSSPRSKWNDTSHFLTGQKLSFATIFEAFRMPLVESSFDALCQPMTVGSPSRSERGYHGLLEYPVGQGPLELGKCRVANVAFFLTGVPPISEFVFPALVEAHKALLCPGVESPPLTYERRAENLEECESLGGSAKWTRTTLRTTGVASRPCQWFEGNFGFVNDADFDTDLLDEDLGPSEDHPNITSIEVNQMSKEKCDWRPPGARKIRGFQYCRVTEERTEQAGTSFEIEVWTADTDQSVEVREDSVDLASWGPCRSNRPNPFLLKNDPGAFRYLFIIRNKNRRHFFSERFTEDPANFFTYAQVEIYNGLSHDAFTQDWRVRLERATLLESAFGTLDQSVVTRLLRPLLRIFGLDGVSFTDAMRLIGNH